MLADANARWLDGRYPSNVWVSCRSVAWQPGAPGLSVQVLNVNRHRSKHMARNHPWKELSPIRRPKHSSPAHAHAKRPTRVQLPVLQPTNPRFTPGRETTFLTNSGGRYRLHAARIDMASATSAATFTPTSAGIRVGAIERPQRPYPPYPHGLGGVSLLRETQLHPRALPRKVPTEANRLHRAGCCRGE